MSSKNKIELWEILVPTIIGTRPVRTKHHKMWDNFVKKVSGGLTILKPAKGIWIEPETKTVYDERVIPVRIACTKNQILQIINFTINHYKQKAVMAYKLSSEVLIIENKSFEDK